MLTQELLAYEVRVQPDANERYGAFRVGRHDDLVTALGLGVQGDDRPAAYVWKLRLPSSDRSAQLHDRWRYRW